jgi:hypothetical protein
MSVIQGDNVVGAKVGGNQWYIVLKNRELAKAYKATGSSFSKARSRAATCGSTRQWAQLQTGRNPEWFIKNFLRDVQEAASTLLADHPRPSSRPSLRTSSAAGHARRRPA